MSGSLKEFEKWQGVADRCGRKCKISKSVCNMISDSLACKLLREEGWRAALEWIKYEGVLEPGLANDLINEELNNERV